MKGWGGEELERGRERERDRQNRNVYSVLGFFKSQRDSVKKKVLLSL
jgi:hypothetical protein